LAGFFNTQKIFLFDDWVKGICLPVPVNGIHDLALTLAFLITYLGAIITAELGDSSSGGEFDPAVHADFIDPDVAAHFVVVSCYKLLVVAVCSMISLLCCQATRATMLGNDMATNIRKKGGFGNK